MNEVINSTEQLIMKINDILKDKKDSVVNIINDKLLPCLYSQSLLRI